MAIPFLAAAACGLVADFTVDTLRIDASARVPSGDGGAALVPDGVPVAEVATTPDGGRTVTIGRTVEVVSAAEAARFLASEGADKIGSIRGVTLELVSASYDGVDQSMTGAPTVTLGDHTLPPGTTSVDLDDAEVEALRVALLTPKALAMPVAFAFHEPAGASAFAATVHVVAVIQPTLHVDVGRSW